MKFFSWLITLLIIAAIVAAFTAPGDKDFTEFVSKDKGGDTMACKPIIENSKALKILWVKLFSFHYVNYCEAKKTTPQKPSLRIDGKENTGSDSAAVAIGKISVPKVTRSETYLGLFGRFWKL
jgi:hypothetical protein